jgi:hypothetical protein
MNNLREDEVSYVLRNVKQLDLPEFREFLIKNISKILLSKISEDKFRNYGEYKTENASFNLFPRRFYSIVTYCMNRKLSIGIYNDNGYNDLINNILDEWVNYTKKYPFRCYNLIRAYIIWKEDI